MRRLLQLPNLRPSILHLSLALVSFVSAFTLRSQEVSVAPRAETAGCVRWIKETVPTFSGLDPADFCAGVERGNLGGWYSVFKCGRPEQQLTGTPAGYCASSGQISASEAWAVGFRSTTGDGHELLDETSVATKGSHPVAATFYSNTALSMGSLRLPPGMYDLMPSKSPEGWKLEVAKWSDVPDHQKYLGFVEMKGVAPDKLGEKNYLEISMWPWAARCSNLIPYLNFWELHFIYGSTDLFVCIRPDQRPFDPQENISALH
jgi:hypothetical protein